MRCVCAYLLWDLFELWIDELTSFTKLKRILFLFSQIHFCALLPSILVSWSLGILLLPQTVFLQPFSSSLLFTLGH